VNNSKNEIIENGRVVYLDASLIIGVKMIFLVGLARPLRIRFTYSRVRFI
jgi:hypothetical protein